MVPLPPSSDTELLPSWSAALWVPTGTPDQDDTETTQYRSSGRPLRCMCDVATHTTRGDGSTQPPRLSMVNARWCQKLLCRLERSVDCIDAITMSGCPLDRSRRTWKEGGAQLNSSDRLGQIPTSMRTAQASGSRTTRDALSVPSAQHRAFLNSGHQDRPS